MPVTVLVTPEFALSAEREADWLAALPPEREAELRRWADRRDRRRSLLGTRLLRDGMRRLGIDDPDAALATLRHAPRARPTVDRPLHFSIAHTEGRVVCAVSATVPVGVDVEAVAGVDATAFGRYLSAAERAWAGSSPRRFATLWTRKEAVAKAAGSRGLAAVPEIDALAAGGAVVHAGRAWQVMPIDVGRRHVAHLAFARRGHGGDRSGAVMATIERPGRAALVGAAPSTPKLRTP